MIIGGTREQFGKLTPKTIKIDFEAYKERQKRAAQDRWEIGAYLKSALASSVLITSFYDDSIKNKIPEFPQRPYEEEDTTSSGELTPQQIKAERERAKLWIMSL